MQIKKLFNHGLNSKSSHSLRLVGPKENRIALVLTFFILIAISSFFYFTKCVYVSGSSSPEENEVNDDVDDGIDSNTDDDNYQITIPEGAAWDESISERFDPSELLVPIGAEVTWTNHDDLTHTVTSGYEAGYGLFEFIQDDVFNSGHLEEGDTFSFQFNTPGRFGYFCVPHPWMSGVIIVEEDG